LNNHQEIAKLYNHNIESTVPKYRRQEPRGVAIEAIQGARIMLMNENGNGYSTYY